MGILVVGGDRIEKIKNKLRENGFNKIVHVTGRKKGDRKIKIPSNTDIVVVLIDYIGHNMAEIVKQQSKRNNITVMFCKHSWSSINKNINTYMKKTS
ncbi:DUF2325 domain-containing protein [Clostridium sp. MT-14]|jgi:hypothetical protein|uniref:DUF2325 domain-containing protein n=1 Tax=Clostridium aromativorans TaxID=2836848 RepID=A0ABS8N5W0_9CLOT|nr:MULTISPECIES: DUF2325 domain-containing protein [Clostridium]KAA8673346.1 DUF2325 domain-containing protein [Clostridium sp. HV4-5-A1G]MCC9295193.1 DUF2325 domain-containing protein [Clostridium aromativorans]CAB1247884.1 conserved hypothetical protein [Clostridiaceae bacterium BL-3]